MNEAAATEAEFWHVQLPTGDVRYWSLEELDEAFQRDEVDAKTYVLKEGESTWQRLGELLGLDESESAPAPVSQPVPTYSIPPYSVGGIDSPAAFSIRPVVSDVGDMDDDDLAAAMKPKKKNMAYIAGGVAAALVLAVVGITQASGSSDSKVAAAAPPPAAVVAPPVAAPAADPAPPQATLSDDLKKQLLDADKARAAKSAAKAAENAKYTTKKGSYRVPKSGNVFHKGGDKYDPLNSAL
jgi:pyruvate/2-oxoglutarate dehydrogenase complex dihydrolipoamide acyltransferase (E2) component